jgi:hypothetical protein
MVQRGEALFTQLACVTCHLTTARAAGRRSSVYTGSQVTLDTDAS